MEQSTRFISLSGLSGILAGIYALIGAWITNEYFLPASDITAIIITGVVVLGASLITAGLMSRRNAHRQGVKIFNKSVRLLLYNLAIPLATGGVFTLILLYNNYFELLAACMMIFYGLSLVNASKYTAEYIRTLGFFEIVLGLVAAVYTDLSLVLWSIGFGWLHIIYSAYVYWKYER